VRDLDARQYPLAATPTPAALKNLKFKIGDKSIIFNEPDDSASVATEVSVYITAVALFKY
jgi:F-box and WD-40 domain protein CDC4